MEWINIEDQQPRPGDEIVAELKGCKIGNMTYVYLTVREGEGLGHIKRWQYTDKCLQKAKSVDIQKGDVNEL
jgi:hypothetical protein